MLFAILSQALVFTPVSFGMYISAKILKITDLAIDGSFLLGAAAFTLCSLSKINPFVGIACALAAGAITGLVSSAIQYKNRVQPIIAGILTVFFTHGAFFFFMKGPNVGLHDGSSFFQFTGISPLFLIFATIITTGFCAHHILTSSTGLALRTFGSNPQLLVQLGKRSELYRQIGLAIGNSCAGLAGALTAQQNGYADVSMGFGVALIGIATLLIGQHFASQIKITRNYELATHLFFCFVGTLVYFSFITILLVSGINPIYLKSIFALALSFGLHATSA